MPNTKSRIVWMSTEDSSILVDTADQARELAEKNPTETKYRRWIQVLIIEG